MRFPIVVVTFALANLLGCSSSPESGQEGGPCYPNGTCNAGLECIQDACHSVSGADAGNTPDSAAPIDAGPNCPTGSDGCACYGNDTCDGALVCQGGTCGAMNCTDECGPAQTTPVCSEDERSTVTCEDGDGDGCLEELVQETCVNWCDYFESEYQCVECRDDDDCGDPIRERCDTTTRSCEGRVQWSITSLTYSDGASTEQRDYSNCYFCDAFYQPAGNHSLLRYQTGGGYTIWALYVHNAATIGSETLQPGYPASGSYFTLTDSDSSLPARFQGQYRQVSGTVTFTETNLADGGAIAATATVVLENLSRPESRATLTVEFYARFPE